MHLPFPILCVHHSTQCLVTSFCVWAWPPYPEWTSMLSILSVFISLTHRPSAIPTSYKGHWETGAHTLLLWVFFPSCLQVLVIYRVSHKLFSELYFFNYSFLIMIFIFFHYSWFTVFCQLSTVQQSDPAHTHIYILFLTLSSTMLHHKWLDIVPPAIQYFFNFCCTAKWPNHTQFLCCTEGPNCPSIPNTTICIWKFQTPGPYPVHPTP